MTEMVPEQPLPSVMDVGFVVAEAIRVIGDTVQDEDRHPGVLGSTGSVTFTPLTRQTVITGERNAFVTNEPIVGRLVDGMLVDASGAWGIYLPTGQYRVTYSLNSGTLPYQDILVLNTHTEESPLYLVLAAPPTPIPGAPITYLPVSLMTVEQYQALTNPNPGMLYMLYAN